MNQNYINKIEQRLEQEQIEIEYEMDEDDVTEYFEVPDIGSLPFTSDSLINMTLGSALSDD